MGNNDEREVNLEMPSLGFGRKKRRQPDEEWPDEPLDASEEAVDDPTDVLPLEPEPEPAAEPEVTRTLAVDDPVPASPSTPSAPETAAAPSPVPAAGKPAQAPKPAKPAKAPRPPREFALPAVPGMVAAAITGLVIGLFIVGSTYLGLTGCEAVNGTSSCGGPGFVILMAILVASIVGGGALLKALRAPDATSTSFLAVGLVTVIVLLFLMNVIFEWWMVIAIPVLTIAAYVLAHWVTVKYIEPAGQD